MVCKEFNFNCNATWDSDDDVFDNAQIKRFKVGDNVTSLPEEGFGNIHIDTLHVPSKCIVNRNFYEGPANTYVMFDDESEICNGHHVVFGDSDGNYHIHLILNNVEITDVVIPEGKE